MMYRRALNFRSSISVAAAEEGVEVGVAGASGTTGAAGAFPVVDEVAEDESPELGGGTPISERGSTTLHTRSPCSKVLNLKDHKA
jgi:hypothetical protein